MKTLLIIILALMCAGSAFAQSLDLPDDLRFIGEEAFMGNAEIEKVILPEGLEAIESRAFAATNINSLYIQDLSRIRIADDAFDGKTLYVFPMDTDELVIGLGQYAQIRFAQYPAMEASEIHYKSADPTIILVDSNGIVSGRKTGSSEITLTDSAGNSANLMVTVKPWAQLNPHIAIAHRGASGYYTDNTLAAFRHAHELGADMIELDVRKTEDDVIICFHDAKISDKYIKYLSLKEVRRYQSDICTLEEALECISALGDIGLQIEFKVSGIEKEVVALVEQAGMRSRTCYGSFKISVLNKVKSIDPSAETVYIMNDKDIIADVADDPSAYNVNAYSITKALLTEELICKLHLAGKQVYGWTLNTAEEIATYAAMGLDGIITNYPDLVNR